VAFPAIQTTNVYNATSGTSHAINLPASIASGDLLLAFVTCNAAPSLSFPAGWTQIFDTANGTQMRLVGYYRDADGTEGSTVTVTLGTSQRCGAVTYRITGHDTGAPPQSGTAVAATTANPDPPSLTPTGGAKDYLWFEVVGIDNSANQLTAASTGYANIHESTATANNRVSTARRESNASTEDPGTCTITASTVIVVNTVAVHPAAGGATPSPGLGAVAITGGGTSLGFAILMPPES
jgi:hypothetical protein